MGFPRCIDFIAAHVLTILNEDSLNTGQTSRGWALQSRTWVTCCRLALMPTSSRKAVCTAGTSMAYPAAAACAAVCACHCRIASSPCHSAARSACSTYRAAARFLYRLPGEKGEKLDVPQHEPTAVQLATTLLLRKGDSTPLTREMSARTSGALMLMNSGEDPSSASWKCTSSSEDARSPEAPSAAPMRARTCSQACRTLCAPACLAPAQRTSAVTAGRPSPLRVAAGGTISSTQLACTPSAQVSVQETHPRGNLVPSWRQGFICCKELRVLCHNSTTYRGKKGC